MKFPVSRATASFHGPVSGVRVVSVRCTATSRASTGGTSEARAVTVRRAGGTGSQHSNAKRGDVGSGPNCSNPNLCRFPWRGRAATKPASDFTGGNGGNRGMTSPLVPRMSADGLIPIASSLCTLHEGRQVREEGIGGGMLLRALCDLGVKATGFWYDSESATICEIRGKIRDRFGSLNRSRLRSLCYLL